MPEELIEKELLLLSKGSIVRLPESMKREQCPFTHLYWCAACNEVLRSKSADFDKCKNCSSPYWRGVASTVPRYRVGRGKRFRALSP